MADHVCGGPAETPTPGLARRALRAVAAKIRPWRTAKAIDVLRAEVNVRWPNRSKASDGTIGDAAHASRSSDHNPWIIVAALGVVRAFDCTAQGIDAAAYAEHLRQLGKAGDPRLAGGGYVIFNHRIASERDNWAWRPYTGPNGHTKHAHLSLSRNRAGFDSTATWGIDRIGRTPAPLPVADPNAGRVWRQFSKGATDTAIYNKRIKPGRNDQVSELQILLATLGFMPMAEVDGVYGWGTLAAVQAFKRAASWLNTSSTVDLELIATLRALVAAR